MSSVLGALEVQMTLDTAKWASDWSNTNRVMDQGLASMKNSMGGMLAGLTAGLSVAAFGNWIKSAIDAGDATKEFSQKTGVAAKDVAGLQLAFRQGGVDGDALSASMGKLSKQMVEGNKAFDLLGVSTRNTDGSVRDVMEVLYDTADAFAGYEDGAAKSALAQEIFGKAGAALIPTLNEGSKGMREMADIANKLGLTISAETAEAADKFNDTLALLGQGSQGMARQVAAELLPTLNSLAGSMLKNKLEGDGMKKMADAISFALKSLFTVGAIGVGIFDTLGKVIGGAAATLIAIIKGEYSEAWSIAKETAQGVGESIGGTASTISDAWTGAGSKSVENMVAMTTGLKKLTPATKDQEAASKKLADEQAKLIKVGKEYLIDINEQYGAMQKQISLGRELTDGEKELVKLSEKLAQGKMILSDAERVSVELKLRGIDAAKEQRRQGEEYLKTLAAVAQHASKWNDEQAKLTDGMRSSNVQLIEQNDKLRMTDAAWAAREQAVLLNQAADLEWQAANQGGNFQLEEQARLLRERAMLLADGTVLREAKAAADEWKKTTDSIGQGLTDSLFRAFEAGAGFFDALVDGIKNTFKTTALKLIITPVQQYLTQAVNTGAGVVGSAAQSGLGSLTGTAASMWRGTGLGATALAAGNYGAVYSGAAYGTGFGTQQSAMLAAQEAGMTSSAGSSSMMSMGPWVAAIAAMVLKAKSDYEKGWNSKALDQGWMKEINKVMYPGFDALRKTGIISDKWADILGGVVPMARIFGRKPAEATAQGISGSFGAGGFVGQQFVDWKAKGGWFRSDKTGTNTSALDDTLGASLNSSAQDLLQQTTAYAKALALPVTELASITTSARVVLGDDAAKNAEAIAAALAVYGSDLAKGYAAALQGVSEPGEAATETLTRIGQALLTVNTTFETLGLHLVRTSVAGGSFAAELVALSGGLDAFLSKTQTYLGAYFTESEQLGVGANSVLRTLQDAGIDFSGAASRGDLRKRLEGLDPNTASGREQMSALLTVAGDFAKLADYLAANDLTLGQLASQAPVVGLLVDDPATRSATAGEQSAALLQTTTDRLADIAGSSANSAAQLQALLALQTAANQALVAQLQRNEQATLDAARLADLAPPGGEGNYQP